jgi:pimeloyl-ACP methyl ester carboxylesterase
MSESSPQTPEIPSKKRTPIWKRILRSAILCYVLLLLILVIFQRDLIYHPTKNEKLSQAGAMGVLADVHHFEFAGADGVTLHGWHYSRALSDSHPEDLSDSPRVVLYFPGNAGNRSYRVTPCEMLANFGCDVLSADYRGFGDNPVSPTEETLISDAMALWKHANEEMKIPHDRIVLFGESLGGGVAVQLAAEQSRQGTPPEGLVIQSSFNSLVAVAQSHYPIMPAKWLLRDQFDSASQVGEIECRYLHVHGDIDRVVPYSCGRALFEAASDDIDKTFVTLENAGHNDLYSDPKNFVPFSRAIKEWLEDKR